MASKSTADHEKDGTFRAHRHADRAENLFPKGPPPMPDGLDGHQRYMWSLVVENVPERVISPADAADLLMLCSWWATWRTLSDDLTHEVNPKTRLCLMNQLSMASKHVGTGLKRFGMNPASRTALKVPGGKAKSDAPLAKLLSFRAGQLKPSKS